MYRLTPGSASIIWSIAGAAQVVVTACFSISLTASSAMNIRMMTLVAPTLKQCMNQAMPAECSPGKQIRLRSSGRQSIQSAPARVMLSMKVKNVRWASTTPLGRPVVPLVYICTTGSSVPVPGTRSKSGRPPLNARNPAVRSLAVSISTTVRRFGRSAVARPATPRKSRSTKSTSAPESRRMWSTSPAVSRQLIGTSTVPLLAQPSARS